MEGLLYKELSYQVQGAFFEVYKAMGCSFKESSYDNALFDEFTVYRRLLVERQKRIGIYFKGRKVGAYVPDQIVENKIIIEIKAKVFLTKQDLAQFWDYLKGSEYKVGYLVNFGKSGGVEYIRRVYDTARVQNQTN
jgi:GxxExxY protein